MLRLVYSARYRLRNRALIGIRLDAESKLYHYSHETVKAAQLALYLCTSGTTQYLFRINHK